MKVYHWAAIGMAWAVLGVLSPGRCLAAETYVLIRVADIDRKVEMQVMSATELKELEKTLQLEKKLFPEALRIAMKEWREDDFNKGSTFPAARLSPRGLVGSSERFSSQEKADAKINEYYERDAQKDSRQREKTKPKALNERDRKKEQDAVRAMKILKDKLEELMDAKTKAAEAEEKKVEEKKPVDKADAMKAAAKAL
jgi:hypothetical protein